MDIENLRKEYLAALDWYDEAAAELPAALQASNHSLAVVRAQVRAGRPMNELLAELEPDRRRSRLSAAIDDLVRARHEAQRSLYSILVAEGMSMSDVASGLWDLARFGVALRQRAEKLSPLPVGPWPHRADL